MMKRVSVVAGVVLLIAVLVGTADAIPSDVERVAVLGDSITTGYGVAPGEGYADLLESDRAGDNVLVLAHDGATARRWMTTYLAELTQLTVWQPSAVLVALGGNDWYGGRRTAEYQTDLTYLVWHIRAAVPGVRVILWHYHPFGIPQNQQSCDVWPCDPAASTWAQYGSAMYAAAARNWTGYIDTSVGAPSGQPWSAYYLPDRVHLTPEGHRQLHDSIRARLVACC